MSNPFIEYLKKHSATKSNLWGGVTITKPITAEELIEIAHMLVVPGEHTYPPNSATPSSPANTASQQPEQYKGSSLDGDKPTQS